MWSKGKRVTHKNQDKRITFLMVIIFLFGLLVIFRLFGLQVLNYAFYAALASGQHEIYKELFPSRGEIFVYNDVAEAGKSDLYALATNRDLMLVYAVPTEIENPEEAAQKLSPLLNIPEEELLKKLAKEDDPYEPLKHKLNLEEMAEIKKLNIKGINFIAESFRYYPEKNQGSHLLGFMGFEGDELKGKYGLEGYFEEELKGKQGSLKLEKDAFGRWITVAERNFEKAEDGADLILTIDRSIQFVACDELEKAVLRHGADGGTVIIMEPKTGAIIAMCSYPDYDPNEYSEVENINIFNNPAVFGAYEPGSIFKAITMASALDSEKVTPETTYMDEGFVKIADYTIKNSDEKAHGEQTMTEVLEKSLNTGAIFVAREMGHELFLKYIEAFGFGEATGIEQGGEARGNIESLKQMGEIYLATTSFGQGVTVTPIQMVTSFAALANGGKLVRPYMVEEIVKENGEFLKASPQEIRQVISPRASALISGMLVSVVENGHGQRAGVEGYYVAGKTGTAQVPKKDGRGYDSNKTIGSFVGFAPVDEPKFVMLVKIDDPKDVMWAESSAAPLFGKLAAFMLNYYEVPPER